MTSQKKSTIEKTLSTYINLLENSTSSNDALQVLIQISDNISTFIDEDTLMESIRKLNDHYKRENESAVRVKVLALLSEFANDSIHNTNNSTSGASNVDCTALIEEIIILLRNESSPKVISQGLYSIYKIGECQPLANIILTKVVALAKQQLCAASHNIQRHALLLLGAFAQLSDAETEILSLVAQYTDSQDSRVRAQAFRSILMLGKRGVILTPSLYTRAIKSLKDDYECVRKEALQLVYELSIKHPEQ